MNKLSCITLSLTLALSAGAAQAFSLGEAARITSAVAAPGSSAAQSADLVNQLTALNVTPEQAVGGTGALLELARNQLPGADYSQLLQSAPALKQLGGDGLASQASAIGGLLGKSNPLAKQPAQAAGIQSMTDVAAQFSSLGMDGGMISQFTPVLLQFIGNQGVGQPLLGTLTSLWSGQPAN